MLDVYEILGLKEATLNMRDQREHLNFSKHQSFFQEKILLMPMKKSLILLIVKEYYLKKLD